MMCVVWVVGFVGRAIVFVFVGGLGVEGFVMGVLKNHHRTSTNKIITQVCVCMGVCCVCVVWFHICIYVYVRCSCSSSCRATLAPPGRRDFQTLDNHS